MIMVLITMDIMEREIGGLGVHFIRNLVEEVSYRRENGRNILRMKFNALQNAIDTRRSK